MKDSNGGATMDDYEMKVFSMVGPPPRGPVLHLMDQIFHLKAKGWPPEDAAEWLLHSGLFVKQTAKSAAVQKAIALRNVTKS